MTKLLIVLGSARKGRVADAIKNHVVADIESRSGIKADVADLKKLQLPYFDGEIIPSSPDYSPTDESVKTFATMVADSDGVIFITPEYNHSLSAIEKNAIDSLYKEWEDKAVTTVVYSWSGGTYVLPVFQEVMKNVKASLKDNPAQLAFMKDINPDGSLLDETTAKEKIKLAIDVLLAE